MSGKSAQIFGVILFIAVGVSAIFLGIKQYTQKITSPFAANVNAVTSLNSQLNGAPAAVDKTKDTDGDGLSDYDEINIYHTSPYLKDSDSDGIPDGVEVKNGTDPNCPQGQTCSHPVPTGNLNAPDASAAINFDALQNEESAVNSDQTDLNTLINNPANAPASGTGSAPTTASQTPATNSPSAADIRAMLINAGLDQAALTGISDSDLVQLYNESLSETEAQAENANGNANANANVNTP